MGFTIEDMLTVSKDRFRMRLAAGRGGWSNSISFLLMLEDVTIIQNFSGKELAVTTGLGFQTEEALLSLAKHLNAHHASGLLINTGRYVLSIPQSLSDYCDANDLPLLTVPWDVILADMIKDLSIRIFLQGDTDEQISASLIQAIEEPENRDEYCRHLLPHFDVDGTFQIVLISTKDLDKMDTVDRRRLSYRMQLYLSGITHNGHFFYYNSEFVLVINAVEEEAVREIVGHFQRNLRRRMPQHQIVVGVSDQVTDISRLRTAYHRAKAALGMALDQAQALQYFSDMDAGRILYLVSDRELLRDMCYTPLAPLLAYDREHNACYTQTLENYLRFDGSIQAVADAMYTHRNTVLYRMNNIRTLLGSDLSGQQDRWKYQIACRLLHMKSIL